ncbi:MAG TPA: 4-aminobutyrate--2-oxoglutarate transaminase [Elusimicrobia bacterium]|nr:4-aminobutyrate--2-oxoglutarate transaminase [Elusimicrobiota bacterium]
MKHTLIKTELPGPKSRELTERRTTCVASPMDSLAPFYIKHGQGAVIEDVDGNRFLDFTGGWGCLVTGYSPEKVVEAIKTQSESFLHSDFTVIPYEPWIELSEMLAKKAKGKSEKAVAFFNSGAEAVENAVKIARGATKRRSIVVFEGAFHGRTVLTMTMTQRPMPYKYVFGTAPDVHRLPYPNPRKNKYSPKDFERLLLETVCPEDVAAVIIEPIQGEGGFNVPPEGFLEEIRRVTAKYGILMVADEVQSGYGRTGKFFAIENWGIEPDLITLGKSIAAGLPLSAVIGDKKYFDSLPKSSIGSTFGGNPLACAAAIEVIRMIDGDKLLERALNIGKTIRRSFEGFRQKYPSVKDVRGIGAMLAIEFIKDEEIWSPDTETCQKVIQDARDNGVILAGAGLNKNVIRLLLPLVITDEQLAEGLGIIDKAIENATKKQPMKVKVKKMEN